MTARQSAVGVGAITIACNILERIPTNAELESLLLEYGLSEAVPGRGSISKTMLELKKFAATHPDYVVQTEYGEKTLSVLVVEEAIRRFGRLGHNVEVWDKLERYLNLDGYALLKEAGADWHGECQEITGIGLAMPEFADLPESSSEVDTLLAGYGLSVAEVHLDSTKKNIAQGNWEAANSQCRAFLEALTDGIADRLYPTESATRGGGLQKRQLLAEKGFLSREKHEFSDGNSHAFLPGLAKLLHSDGAHPGISTQHDALFRLQIVVVTARWLLKRVETNSHLSATES